MDIDVDAADPYGDDDELSESLDMDEELRFNMSRMTISNSNGVGSGEHTVEALKKELLVYLNSEEDNIKLVKLFLGKICDTCTNYISQYMNKAQRIKIFMAEDYEYDENEEETLETEIFAYGKRKPNNVVVQSQGNDKQNTEGDVETMKMEE